MNITAKRSSVSLLLLVGAALFLGACGPELDDPSFLAQAASMQANDANTLSDENKNAMPQDANQDAQPAMAGAPAVAAVPVVKLPPSYAQLPPRVVPNPPILTTSGEERRFERDILVEQPVINDQANINTHVINNHVNTNTKYHTTVYNRQRFANQIAVTGSASATAEILPTTEVELPSIVAPAIGVGVGIGGYGIGGAFGPSIPYNWGWNPTWGVVPGSMSGRPGCARYMSGGFLRNCL